MIQQNSYDNQPQPPLTIVLERLDITPDGRFRPSAFIKLTKAVRTSGLLQALPPEELKSFLILLSFLTPNGACSPTVQQLAGAMHVSQGKARARMQRLAQLRFENQALVIPLTHGNGQEAYALNDKLIPTIEQPIEEARPEPIKAVPRERLIEYSRRRYAKTREEVEKQIAEINGWELPPPTAKVARDKAVRDKALSDKDASDGDSSQTQPDQQPAEDSAFKDLRRRLQNVGVAPDQIEYLLTTFDIEHIKKQLKWLPFRQARNPSAYLVAAIVGDYEEPIYRR